VLRVERILQNPSYLEYLCQNEVAEQERIFCGHSFDHLLAVARLTYIFLLEDGNPYITREMAYAAALLHDIGRWQEYSSGLDHAEVSAELAGPILAAAGFDRGEKVLITKAICQHRLDEATAVHHSPLSQALKKADRYSRLCFSCEARNQCRKLEEQPHRYSLIY
jgi:uncharacterized protein